MIELILLASAIITLRWWLIRRVSLVVISIYNFDYNFDYSSDYNFDYNFDYNLE